MASKMKYSAQLTDVLNNAVELCEALRHQFVTPEHLLYVLADEAEFVFALAYYTNDLPSFKEKVFNALGQQERVPGEKKFVVRTSVQSEELVQEATKKAYYSGKDTVEITHFADALLHLTDSWASYLLLKEIGGDSVGFIDNLIDACENEDQTAAFDDTDDEGKDERAHGKWKDLVTNVNDDVPNHNPLIGREAELERTMQVLCRKDKNNPLHIGEPGVGKTALVYGLAERINEGKVPERLKGCTIYAMDMGTMLAGTQFRGDFEKRIKQVMEGARKEGNVIIYIDEIHNMIGAGRGSDGALDASNMLKPYLESGDIRFIGSTTYDEYKRYFASSKGIVRRFQEIDIKEPSVDDAIKILKGLLPKYEEFHKVIYTDEAVDYAVRSSAKYISDRFLPDKAIDLIDEAGAYRELHPTGDAVQTVDKILVQQVLEKACKIDAAALKDNDTVSLESLYGRVSAKIFGQDEAVRQVVEAIEMSKAGLQDDGKPLASLLFVGPTGVGKTEVAKVLAKELGIELVRFDMSEYTEKS